MTLLRTYTLHEVLLHTWFHGLSTFHAKRDSTQTFMSSFFDSGTSSRMKAKHIASTYLFCNIKRDSMGLRLFTQSEIQFKVTILFELCLQVISWYIYAQNKRRINCKENIQLFFKQLYTVCNMLYNFFILYVQ